MKKKRKQKFDKFEFWMLKTCIWFLLMGVAMAIAGETTTKEGWYLSVFIVVLVLLLPILIPVIKKLFQHYKFSRLVNANDSLDDLFSRYGECPTEFEQYIASLFYDMGFKGITVTPPSNDRGKDIEMYKDSQKYVVEVKLYDSGNKIGREKIQKLHSAMIDSKAHKAIFVTTSDFTVPAIEYAKKFNIDLINGYKLVKMIQSVN